MLQLIASNSFLTVNVLIAKEVGLNAAAMLAELASTQMYWEQHDGLDPDGMFFETAEQIEEHTTLTTYQQASAVKVLEEKGLLKTRRKGIPAKKFYCVDAVAIMALFKNKFSRNLKTGFQETSKQESQFFEVSNKNRDIKNRKVRIDINNTVSSSSLSEPVKEKVADFFAYREEIRKPYKSERSVRTLIAQIEKQEQMHGATAVIRCIDETMQNGWLGIFWDKIPKAQGNSPTDMAEIARMMDEGVIV